MADDREVWSRIIRQDATAFDTFYQENAPRLLAFLRTLVGDHQVAEDLTQESFVQLWSRPQGYEPERGTLRAYLFGIARKRAAEWWRRQRPTELLTEDRVWMDGLPDVDSELILMRALKELAPEHRSLLWLREVEGQSYAELAEILNIPIGTVRSRLHAAREALRRTWHARPAREKETV